MGQTGLFNPVRVRIDGKCTIVDLRDNPEPVKAAQPRPVPFPEMPICEFTGKPYSAWCEVHKRYHADHKESWTEVCTLA
jgi:hypothetical protein